MSLYGEEVAGAEIRRVREKLGEDQTEFGRRFGKHRRTIIRWEQKGNRFETWSSFNWEENKREPSEFERWQEVVKRADARKKKTCDTRRRRGVSQRQIARLCSGVPKSPASYGESRPPWSPFRIVCPREGGARVSEG